MQSYQGQVKQLPCELADNCPITMAMRSISERPFFHAGIDREATRALYLELSSANARSSGGSLLDFLRFTGLRAPLGSSDSRDRFNTPLALDQLEWTLSLTNHPMVRQMADAPTGTGWVTDEVLVKNRILDGMRILDIGCGREPAFARVARALGAHVTTLDIIPASALRFDTGGARVKAGVLAEEANDHLQMSILAEGVVDRILKGSGGCFDLVTSANLESDDITLWFRNGWRSFHGRDSVQVALARQVTRLPAVVFAALDRHTKVVILESDPT